MTHPMCTADRPPPKDTIAMHRQAPRQPSSGSRNPRGVVDDSQPDAALAVGFSRPCQQPGCFIYPTQLPTTASPSQL